MFINNFQGMMGIIIGILVMVALFFFIIAYPAIRQNRIERKEEEARLNFDPNISWLLSFFKENGFVKQNLTFTFARKEKTTFQRFIEIVFGAPYTNPNVVQVIESDDMEDNKLLMQAICERLPKDHYFLTELEYILQFDIKHKKEIFVPQDIRLFEMQHGNSDPINVWSFEAKENHNADIAKLNNYFTKFIHSE